jgi:maltose alpha-D-glucosyltransferase/alpha-amylase
MPGTTTCWCSIRAGARVVTLHNIANQPRSIRLDVEGVERYLPMLSSEGDLKPFPASQKVDLPSRGYCWLRCDRERR